MSRPTNVTRVELETTTTHDCQCGARIYSAGNRLKTVRDRSARCHWPCHTDRVEVREYEVGIVAHAQSVHVTTRQCERRRIASIPTNIMGNCGQCGILDKLKVSREETDWEIEEERVRLVRRVDELLAEWRGRLPNLLSIFRTDEIERLLSEAVKNGSNRQEIRFVALVANSGYTDKPRFDEDDNPSKRRTTPLHRVIAREAKHKYKYIVPNLFRIYDRFDVNYTDDSGYTHFHVACACGCVDVVEKFLELGQDPNCPGYVDSPLSLALANDHEATAESLLRSGADPHSADADGSTPLHLICQGDSCLLAKVMFELDSVKYRPVQIDVRDKFGNTPLHLALRHGHKKLAAFLLRKGADPNVTNEKGSTPLHVICNYHRDEWVEVFFFIVDDTRQAVRVDARDKLGRTPLHLALIRSLERVAELLLRRGADPNCPNNDGSSPLHIICKRCWHDDMMELFFKVIEEINQTRVVKIDAQDKFGDTPLHLALRHWKKRDAASLLRRGADLNLPNAEGSTPLHVLCKENKDDGFAKLLFEISDELNRPLQLEVRDKLGNTPLLLALQHDHKKVAKLLLMRDADPNSINTEGSTPLHVICDKKYNDGSAMMFFEICAEKNHPVQVDARDKKGQTPLQLAVANLLPSVVELLLIHDADLSSFVFPTESHFDERFDPKKDYSSSYRLRLVSGFLGVIEHLEDKGYELDRSDALLVVKFFAKHGLLETSGHLDESWYRDEEFARKARNTKITPDLSLHALIQLPAAEAAKLVTHGDYFKLARSDKLSKFHRGPRRACALRLCDKLSRGFFRSWAVYFFMELTHYRLPFECCEKIVDEPLKNEDFCNICLAVTIQTTTDQTTTTGQATAVLESTLFHAKNARKLKASRLNLLLLRLRQRQMKISEIYTRSTFWGIEIAMYMSTRTGVKLTRL
uniref:Uncharacterized protein n=1 Tax=Trichogramma kaykai TaxID=54128 RepID=A0ABD2W1A7_9HYME